MGWSAFLDEAVVRAASVTGISQAVRAANVDPDKILKIPGRWPKALVHNLGGSVDVFNGGSQNRLFGVTIVVFVPRAALGGEAEKTLAGLSELMSAEFTHTREGSTIRLVGDTQEVCEAVGAGEFYMSTLIFQYWILS